MGLAFHLRDRLPCLSARSGQESGVSPWPTPPKSDALLGGGGVHAFCRVLCNEKKWVALNSVTHFVVLMVGDTGLEPVTSCMSSKHSNHLS